MTTEWPGDVAVRRLADWITRGRSPQQVAARYRSAVARDFVETDGDFALLSRAREAGLDRLRWTVRR